MNTTVTIHLAHTLFHIDSDAFALLKNYLNKLEKSFAQTEGKQEILEDIAYSIAVNTIDEDKNKRALKIKAAFLEKLLILRDDL